MNNIIIAGKYKVVRLLGEGTFGKVYLVEHTDIASEFALKVLKRSLSDNNQIVERFKKEARILLKFSHPGSVQLRDFGKTEEGLYYFATDFCPGISLDKLLEEYQHFELARALEITAKVLDVLQAAHEHGITHRDIKPGNVLFETLPSGAEQVRILDFGIARLRDAVQTLQTSDAEHAAYQLDRHVENCAIGTPRYMSPEQAAGEPDLDHRVDIYSCGVMLYELIAGTPPYDDEDVLQLLIKHLTQPPPPFDPKFGIPNAVESMIFKALAKDKAHRYQTASEFSQACRTEVARLAAKGNLANIPSPEATAVKVSTVSTTPGALRILCLDDTEMILDIMQHLLTREGFSVTIASNFSYIHDFVFVEKVPLMICDINMPGLPGNKICQMLKQSRPDLKIILFSNIPDRELETLAKEAKADGWLSKNTKPDNWVRVIKEMADRIRDS